MLLSRNAFHPHFSTLSGISAVPGVSPRVSGVSVLLLLVVKSAVRPSAVAS